MLVKYVEKGYCWECENMDNLAPITRQGIEYLLTNGKRVIEWDNTPTQNTYIKASEQERQNTLQKMGFLFDNQRVKIIGGRTIPHGTIKTIKGFFTFEPTGTYGHKTTNYVIFTDNTKIQTKHIRPLIDTDQTYFTQFKNLSIGGRK